MKKFNANKNNLNEDAAFGQKVLKQVYKLFYTENFDKSTDNILSLKLNNVGLFHLSIAEDILKKYLNSVLDMITDNIDFNVINNKIIK